MSIIGQYRSQPHGMNQDIQLNAFPPLTGGRMHLPDQHFDTANAADYCRPDDLYAHAVTH